MQYQFPIIRHISDVLPHVQDDPRFTVSAKDGGYTVVNYVRYDDETFVGDPVRRECRGIIFDTKTGIVLSRPFHKFFNVNENSDVLAQEIDVSRGHALLHKLDGSMIRPIPMPGGGIRWGTKMGLTDIGMQAETFVTKCTEHFYKAFAEKMHTTGHTPIFEWMSRDNRIVIDHEKEQLVLLAVRNNLTGEYVDMRTLAYVYCIPVVEKVEVDFSDIDQLIKTVKEMEDSEGIVMRFDDGNMLKVKSDWYINLHRIKSAIADTRHLVQAILEDRVDDLYPLLPEKDRQEVKDFVSAFGGNVEETVNVISEEFFRVRNEYGMTRKDFALSDIFNSLPIYRSIIFRNWDTPANEAKHSVRKSVHSALLDHTSNNKRFDMVKEMFGSIKWTGGMFG